MSDRFAKWMTDNPPLTKPQVTDQLFPGENPTRVSGRNYYAAKGLKGIMAQISPDTKKKLRMIAALRDVSVLVLGRQVLTKASKSPNPLPKISDREGKVENAFYVLPETRRSLKIHSFQCELLIKEYCGSVIEEFVENYKTGGDVE